MSLFGDRPTSATLCPWRRSPSSRWWHVCVPSDERAPPGPVGERGHTHGAGPGPRRGAWPRAGCSSSTRQYDFSQHPTFICETPFVGPGMRHDPQLDYLPMRLSLVPRLFDTVRPPDAVLLHTSTPRQGKVSLGIEVNILPAAIEQARRRGRLVLAQVNPRMPYTYGDCGDPPRRHRRRARGGRGLPSPRPARLERGGRGHRRAGRLVRVRRRHAAARHRADPRRGGPPDVVTT